MKAVVFKGAGQALALEERNKPVAGAGELVLRVTACGICGSDLHVAKTGFVPEGLVMGHEFCGQVEEVGAGVQQDVHYFDITGEIPIYEVAHARRDQANKAGRLLLYGLKAIGC